MFWSGKYRTANPAHRLETRCNILAVWSLIFVILTGFDLYNTYLFKEKNQSMDRRHVSADNVLYVSILYLSKNNSAL